MDKPTYQNWHLAFDEDNIGWLKLDVVNAGTNILSSGVLMELDSILDELKSRLPQGVVIMSGKSNGFIAGADIKEFTTLKSREQALQLISRGQAIMDKVEALPCPTVSMIHGFCLGGGLELALACRYRVVSDDPKTKLGLPEVRLGIHPGFGGTVRSIRCAGAIPAMDIMLSGRTLNARQAKKIGLADDCIPYRQLKRAARHFVLNAPEPRRPGWVQQLAGQRFVRPLIAKQLRKKVAEKAPPAHYPAPYKLIDLWTHHADKPQEMLRQEPASVSQLITDSTAQNLVRVFQLQEQLKAQGKSHDFNPTHVHVIGGGIMGGDIAAWCALQGLRVTLQDREPAILARAVKRARQLFNKRVKDKYERQAAFDRLIPDHQGLGVPRADLIIEAIFEDAEVKRKLFKEIEPRMKEGAILASNTSSIPLETLAEDLVHPERLVGLHFFNPVAKMPLLEVVRGENTSDDVFNSGLAFGKHIGKLPLAVKSTPGFLVNRILMPYLLEAVQMHGEGIPAEAIDKAAVDFGMPMGPIELADKVGLDVCYSVAKILSTTLGSSLPSNLNDLIQGGKLGVKSGEGFYQYAQGKPVKNTKLSYDDTDELRDRMILRLLNEAMACLREQVVSDENMLDAGVIFGTGFAPFRGGPMHYIHNEGLEKLKQRLHKMEQMYGERFAADEGWFETDSEA